MDELDLELAARLRPDEAPDPETETRHRGQLTAVIQAAVAGTAPIAGPALAPVAPVFPEDLENLEDADDAELEDAPIVPLSRPAASPRRRRSRRRVVALAAATVALAGGLVAVTRMAGSPGDGTTTGDQPTASVGCGTELPFTIPAVAGFEGPFPGLSEGAPTPPELSPDTLLLHWESADATIDLRWPSYPPLDPETGLTEGTASHSDHPPEPLPETGRWASRGEIYTRELGAVECSGLDLTAISGDAAGSRSALDQIQMALLGPSGPLVPEWPRLVTDTTSADTLPRVVDGEDRCVDDRGSHPNVRGTVEGTATHPTSREALGFYLATEPVLGLGDYQEIALPDGSFGYALHAGLNGEITVVLHVVQSGGGWKVASFEHTAC